MIATLSSNRVEDEIMVSSQRKKFFCFFEERLFGEGECNIYVLLKKLTLSFKKKKKKGFTLSPTIKNCL